MAGPEGVRVAYGEQLDQLRNTVLRLGTFAGDMLARALEALLTHDVAAAREVHRSDDVADDLDHEIEHRAIALLASQQPVARDLRGIVGALKIATDLERVADYAKDIAKVAVAIGDAPWFRPLDDVQALGNLAVAQLRHALRAFADHDLDLARQVAAGDEDLDTRWHELWAALQTTMQRDPQVVPQAMRLVMVGRYLERIGDHTINVMERLQYIETGRHDPLVT